MYDNALGRFYNIDPMTEIMPSLSPNRFAFNNPVVWKDPSGLLEVNEDEIPVIALEEVVVSAKGKSSKSVHDTGLPGNHNYWMMPKNYRAVSTEYYNKKYGTDFKSFDDWYYRTKYLPFKQEMICEMHAAQAKAGQAVMALVGSVFVLPILVASSPAAISAFSATISHPLTQYSFSMGLSSAFSQQLVNGEVDQADVAVSMIPGGAGVQALKPMFSAAIDFTNSKGFNVAGINKSNTSFFRDAATGYIFHGLSFGASPANGLRNFGEVPLNTVLNTG